LRRAAALFITAVLAVALAAPARAQDPAPVGVGSTSGAASVVAVDLGSLLNLALIGESSSSTIDPAVGTSTATETLAPLVGNATALGAFGAPTVQVTSTGPVDSKGTELLDLSTLGVPGLTGTINAATLQALVDDSGAKSSLSSTLTNVGVLGGVANVDSAGLDLGGVAGPTASDATRAITVDGVTVLDLRALLSALGLDLNTLPLSTLTDLIDQLGLVDTLNSLTGLNLPNAAALVAMVTDLNSQLGTVPADIADLQGQVTALQGQLATAQGALTSAQGQLATATGQLTTATSSVSALQAQLAPLQSQLTSVQNAINGSLVLGVCNDALLGALLPGTTCAAAAAQVSTLTGQISGLTNQISTLNGQIATLNTTISTLNATISSLNAQITALTNTINGLLAQIAALAGPLTGLLDQLHNLLDGVAQTLDLAPLLRVEGVDVGAVASAKDTVANSSATVTGAIGSVKIGGLDLGGLDVNATVAQVQALATQVTGVISSVLSTISPSLANLVHVDLLQQSTDVSQGGSYVNALAGITGLVATVTPPDVCALVNELLAQLPTGLNSLPGVTLPALPVPAVLSALGSTVTCSSLIGHAGFTGAAPVALPSLLDPVTIAVGSVTSAASFVPASASSPTQTPVTTPATTGTGTTGNPGTTSTTHTGSTLPVTGGEAALTALVGALLLMGALGLRRILLLAKPTE
jgi:predicted  nucleic acid-binding Zn-ribbon protein